MSALRTAVSIALSWPELLSAATGLAINWLQYIKRLDASAAQAAFYQLFRTQESAPVQGPSVTVTCRSCNQQLHLESARATDKSPGAGEGGSVWRPGFVHRRQ